MAKNYDVSTLRSDDFKAIMQLEETIFSTGGEETLGPYYVRLCCDFFNESCFLVRVRGRPVGYLLSFVKGRECYCTTLAVIPEYQGTRVVHRLLMAFTRSIIDRVDECWFTVKETNAEARALHTLLGATNLDVRDGFYGPGDVRLVSKIDRKALDRLRTRYERLGLVRKRETESTPVAPARRPGQDVRPLVERPVAS